MIGLKWWTTSRFVHVCTLQSKPGRHMLGLIGYNSQHGSFFSSWCLLLLTPFTHTASIMYFVDEASQRLAALKVWTRRKRKRQKVSADLEGINCISCWCYSNHTCHIESDEIKYIDKWNSQWRNIAFEKELILCWSFEVVKIVMVGCRESE